jgi:cytochrome oxidase Cu insertion factor (SCO1/SenC/PrrC family)
MRNVGIALLLACSWVTALAVAQSQKDSGAPLPGIKVGDVAPDFTLVDQNGQPHSLHDYKGKKNVALAFYVWAFSPN